MDMGVACRLAILAIRVAHHAVRVLTRVACLGRSPRLAVALTAVQHAVIAGLLEADVAPRAERTLADAQAVVTAWSSMECHRPAAVRAVPRGK